MPIAPLQIDLESNPGRYGPDGGGRLINAYPELAGEKAKAKYPLYPIEGLKSFATLSGGGKTRGAHRVGNFGYVVSATGVFKVDADGNATNLGSFGGSEFVFMASNRKTNPEIMLVSNGLRYLIDTGADTVATISDSDLPAANSCTNASGYFVATIEDGRFFISGIDDGTAWDALDFAEAESQSDTLLVGYGRSGEVALFGEKSIEFWLHTGAAEFPFEVNQGATVRNLGVLCRHAVRDINDVIFFPASDGTVRMLNGYTPERVSTHAVERDIDAVADKDEITATAYSIRGHQFYNLSCDDWTWTYDGLTQLWHERKSYQIDRWQAEGFFDIDGKRIVGNYSSGVLHEIDSDTYDEAGDHLIYTVQLAPAHDYPNELCINRLFVDTIPGTGLNSSDEHVSDPKLMMRVSRNGGKTFGNERSVSVGKIGEFSKRVRFEQLGQFEEDGAVIELSMSAAVIRGITNVAADAELIAA